MSRKRTSYSSEFKVKLVLEVLKSEKPLAQIASENNVLSKNLQNWKKQFLDNAEIAMKPSKVVKEYKKQVKDLEKKVEKYAKTVGVLTVERDWAVGKKNSPQKSNDLLVPPSKSLDLLTKRAIVQVQTDNDKILALSRKHQLLGISRSYKYYTPVVNQTKEAIKKRIMEIAEDEFIGVYGEEKVYRKLLEKGYKVSLNTVSKYRRELGIKAILAVKPVSTTVADETHPKYSYKLKDIEVDKPNKVWSTDITYIKINGGTMYLAAIIDWYSKAVLSWRISNTMDTDFVMDVLNEALLKYPKPEIFNTDQGSRPSKATTSHEGGQYTSYIHTQTLKDNGIKISMDSKGRAIDNIAIERFWRSAKCERIYLNEYNSINELKQDAESYINFYNYHRFHQTLDYKRPMEVYDEKKYKRVVFKQSNIINDFITKLQKVA